MITVTCYGCQRQLLPGILEHHKPTCPYCGHEFSDAALKTARESVAYDWSDIQFRLLFGASLVVSLFALFSLPESIRQSNVDWAWIVGVWCAYSALSAWLYSRIGGSPGKIFFATLFGGPPISLYFWLFQRPP